MTSNTTDSKALIERHLTNGEQMAMASVDAVRKHLKSSTCECDHSVGWSCERCAIIAGFDDQRRIIDRLCALLTQQQAEIERLTPQWVPTSERLPTEADADVDGRVYGIMFDHPTFLATFPFACIRSAPKNFTHWQPIRRPEPPAGEGR